MDSLLSGVAIPMTVYLVPEIVRVPPTVFLFSLAYDALSTAAFVSVWDAVKVRPVVIFEVASGPRSWWVTSTPATEYEFTSKDAPPPCTCGWPEPPPWPPPGPPCCEPEDPEEPADPEEVEDFAVPRVNEPSTLVTFRLSAPTALDTPFCAATSVTSEDFRDCPPCVITRSELWVVLLSALASKSNFGRPEELPVAAGRAFVTVMSVPSPYSDFRTLPWACCMPADTELTVMTSAIPSARPMAITRAAFLRRLSSRLR